ncbi:metallophosphoesterase [Desulfoprunum benzoelyticum]|uniref:3',5'-cyclic AMP phosphodiesterase CpdA n=1 Tax=Desulfoprunum benzoelyticum TaxID=1506996 RepID=A0A840UV30_9BACT|nr:3',5'-cyclic AMP phosphodiesterase CpdA [Desulfoprunum benzoelyticum]MBM9530026.1 metallophosphoesterase [Desulfoprunum benzoelyticum]
MVAHCSDLHITRVGQSGIGDFLNKRLLGGLRWQLQRRHDQHDGLLTTLCEDLQRTRPDHIVITGDLTHLSLPAEFAAARDRLQTMGPPDQVTVVPGNHDQYVRTAWRQSFAWWLPYMQGDLPVPQPTAAEPDLGEVFPVLRIRRHVAVIGTSSARPSALHLATGAIGEEQLAKLETMLRQLHGQPLFRILLIHHPPVPGVVSRRRSLTDAPFLQALIARYGVELILFGHAHKTAREFLPGPAGPIPVIGMPSVSSLERSAERRARYCLFHIVRSADRWLVRMEERILDADCRRFIAGPRRELVVSR